MIDLMTEQHPRYIVSEISKNWRRDQDGEPISMLFADVLEHNAAKGYVMVEFRFDRVVLSPDEINETLIVVFQHESHLEDRAMNPKVH